MDFSNFDSRKGAERASKLHLRHPSTGNPLYNEDETPCVVLVVGTESRKVQDAIRQMRRNKVQTPTGKKNAKPAEDNRTMSEVHAELAETAAPLIVGFEGIYRGDEPLTDSEDDKLWFLNLQTINGKGDDGQLSFLEQVLAHSGDRDNYLGNGSAD